MVSENVKAERDQTGNKNNPSIKTNKTFSSVAVNHPNPYYKAERVLLDKDVGDKSDLL